MKRKRTVDPFAAVQNELWDKFIIWDPQRRGPNAAVYAALGASSGERTLVHVVTRSALSRGGSDFEKDYRAAISQASQLKHPGIVQILATGITRNYVWYSTQWVEPTERLAELLAAQGAMGAESVASVAQQISDALAHAHAQGVEHGHISPASVFVDPTGHVLVAEFRTRYLLSLVHNRSTADSDSDQKDSGPESMSPDEMRWRDKHSLALLVHECLAGHALAAHTAGADAADNTATSLHANLLSELRQLSDAREPLSDAQQLELGNAVYRESGRALPSLTELVSALPDAVRIEPDTVAQPLEPELSDSQPQNVYLGAPLMAFHGEPPKEPRRYSELFATIALTACATWFIAAQVMARTSDADSGDVVYVTRSAATVNDAALNAPDTVYLDPLQNRKTAGTAPSATIASTDSLPRLDPGNIFALDPRTTAPPPVANTVASAPAASKLPQRTAPLFKAESEPARTPATQRGASERQNTRNGANLSNVGRQSVRSAAPAVDSAALRAAAIPGKLSISTRPWGYLYVDGLLVGNTPSTDIAVTPGTHQLRVVREGFQPYERSINVAPGGRVRLIDVVLVRLTP